MRLEKPQFMTEPFAALINSRSYFFALKTAVFISSELQFPTSALQRSHQTAKLILPQSMQQYSLQPEKSWEVRHSTQIDSSRSRKYSASVTTCQDFFAAADAVWDALMFYEEIAEDRPFLLRRFLPIPIGTEGCKSEVGSDVKCQYVGGHLVKRVTRIVRGHNYAFEIVEQNLGLRGIRLLGGDYTLRVLSEDCTRVALATHYASLNCPRWVFGHLEAAVCHSFHRYILSAMRSNL
jgi:hypothetical protein